MQQAPQGSSDPNRKDQFHQNHPGNTAYQMGANQYQQPSYQQPPQQQAYQPQQSQQFFQQPPQHQPQHFGQPQLSPKINTDPFQFYQTDYNQPMAGNPLNPNAMGGGNPYGTPSMGTTGNMMYQVPVEVSILAAFGTGGIPGEAPLLEELGVNINHIWQKTFTVLNPTKRIDMNIMEDADLWGPFIFCMAFGAFLLLSGKVHFSYIYGVAMLGWLSIYGLLNLMSEHGADLYKTASVLGYCLLPMVLLSSVSILLRLQGLLGYGLGIASILWCTYSSSSIFVTILGMRNQKMLVAYPVGLLYACFALITIF